MADQIEQIMGELLDKVKSAPEAEQVALKSLIDQICQISENMKQVREVKMFQDLQKTMIEHWIKLKEMCKTNPELLGKIEEWKEKFIESKEAMMELIKGLKDEIVDGTQKVQESWQDMQMDMGVIMGELEKRHKRYPDEWWQIGWHSRGAEGLRRLGLATGVGAKLGEFIAECNKITTGFNLLESALPDYGINEFIELFNTGLREAVKKAVEGDLMDQLKNNFDRLNVYLKTLSNESKKLMKLFNQIKVVRDTKMLKAY